MKARLIILLTGFAFIVACNDVHDKKQIAGNPKSHQVANCDIIINNFMSWYRGNLESLSTIRIVDYGTDSFYRVNFSNAEIYLSKLRQSELFTEGFLAAKEKYIREHDSILAQIKQNDGPPEGFEADLLLYSQEVDKLLIDTSNITVQAVSSGAKEQQLKLKWFDINRLFVIKRNGHKCLIDSIVSVD